jgi:hypothetical protein
MFFVQEKLFRFKKKKTNRSSFYSHVLQINGLETKLGENNYKPKFKYEK